MIKNSFPDDDYSLVETSKSIFKVLSVFGVSYCFVFYQNTQWFPLSLLLLYVDLDRDHDVQVYRKVIIFFEILIVNSLNR
jgi:hypothetical protein